METSQSQLRAIRLILFLGLGFFIMFGPLYTQVFNRKKSKIFHSWDMFPGRALDFYAVSYFERTATGDLPLSYPKVLGLEKKRGRLWRIDNEFELHQINQLLCKATQGKKDIRLQSWYATRQGWKEVSNKERNICKI